MGSRKGMECLQIVTAPSEVVPSGAELLAKAPLRKIVEILEHGDAIGVGAGACFDTASPTSPLTDTQTLDLYLCESLAKENGRIVVEIVRSTARKAHETSEVADLALCWALFTPITSRLPEVHELLDAWWNRNATHKVLRVMGIPCGKGRPPNSVGLERVIACTMEKLTSEGISARKAAEIIAGLRADGIPSARRIANFYSSRGPLFKSYITPYWVESRDLRPCPWMIPEQKEVLCSVYRLKASL